MFGKKILPVIKKITSPVVPKQTEKKEERKNPVADNEQAFQSVDSASSSYGVAMLNINSEKQPRQKFTQQQVEKILKDFLENDSYTIMEYQELFSNLDKLDYENIERHIRNIKILFSMRSNFPNDIIKNGYFYSKEGADAFDALKSILSDKAQSGKVSPLSIALTDYDPNSVLILQKRGLLTAEQIGNSSRLTKLAKMSDEEYSAYNQRVEDSIKATGLSFEELAEKVKEKTKDKMSNYVFDFFQKNCLNRDTVVPQLEILEKLEDFPLEIKGSDLEMILGSVDINNIKSKINTLEQLKKRPDIKVGNVKNVLDFTNEKNEKTVLKILSNPELSISKIIEYCNQDENFIEGGVSAETIIERINNDPHIKTVRAIENTLVNLVPTNAQPTKLNPRKIESQALALVHMTKYPPQKGILLSTRDKLCGSRNSVHFTLNHAVSAHRSGDWDEFPYAIIMPYDTTVKCNEAGKFIEGMPNDLYTNGSVKIPEGAVIVKYNPNLPSGTVNICDYPEIKGVKFIESSQYPHELVPTILEKMGFSHLKADGPMGFFSYGQNNGNNVDDAVLNYSAWKEFCNTQGIKPTRHTGSAADIAEKVIENVGKLCVNNSWGKKDSYRKELLFYLDVAKEWKAKGYFVSYDIDTMASIIKESSTPKKAVEKMERKLGFHPTLKYDYFNDCTFSIPIDIYEEWHKMSDDIPYMRKYIEEHEL